MFERKNQDLLFVLDTNVYVHNLEIVVRYASENKNVKYLIPYKIIKELEHLTFVGNLYSNEALVQIKKLEEQGSVKIIDEVIKPSLVVPYWDNDIIDFYITAIAWKYNAILITADKIMFYIALSKSIPTVFLDYSILEKDEKMKYEEFECITKKVLESSNELDFYGCTSIPKVLIDTSFVTLNTKLVLEYLEAKKENSLGISIQTLIELNKIGTFKDKKFTKILTMLKTYIEQDKIQIIINTLKPSQLNSIWIDSNIDFNIITTAYESYFVLLTSDITMHALAKSQNVKSLYIPKIESEYAIDLEECIFQTIKYVPNGYLKEYELLVDDYINGLKQSCIRYPEVIGDVKQLPFIKKISKDYIFDDKDIIVLHRMKKELYSQRYCKYPQNIISDRDIIVIREEIKDSFKHRQIIYLIKSLKEQKFIKLSDSLLPNVVMDNISFTKGLVSSLNNIVLAG